MMKKIVIIGAILIAAISIFVYVHRSGTLRLILTSIAMHRRSATPWERPQNDATQKLAATGVASAFTPDDIQVGDPHVNYANVEVVDNYPYMVWIEQKNGINGIMWHCGINPDTGDLIPADCRGFKAFESNLLNRANIGIDSEGLYYVGADPQGHIRLVRPTGPTTGIVTTLPTSPDTRRRAYYASLLPNSSKQYISWTLNSDRPGIGSASGGNAWVELQYIDVAEPTTIHTIERQDIRGRIAPMDATVARWVDAAPGIVFGSYSSKGYDLKEFNVEAGKIELVTNDGKPRADLYPFYFGGDEVLMTTAGNNNGQVLTRPAGSAGLATIAQTITVPSGTTLQKPGLLVSFQPIILGRKAYVAYEINDSSYSTSGANAYLQALGQPGEIWVATVLASHNTQWLVSGPEKLVRVEPEPFTGNDTAWVFYSATELGAKGPFSAHWQLRRAATPLTE